MTWSYRFSFTFIALRLFWNKFQTENNQERKKERMSARPQQQPATFNIHKEYIYARCVYA